MKFVRLDITSRKVERQDFLNQPRKLFVLPDNVPDFKAPLKELHISTRRGGLADCMRPNKLGGTASQPIYDLISVGVPTLSYDPKDPIQTKHIQQAFIRIYQLLKDKDFDEIVVPFKGGNPAFGGGVAGKINSKIKKQIESEFNTLENFVNKKISLKQLPLAYQKAYNKKAMVLPEVKIVRLSKKPANSSNALDSKNFLSRVLDRPYPNLRFFIKGLLGFACGGMVYSGLPLSLPIVAVGAISAIAAGFSFYLCDRTARLLFGSRELKFAIKGRKSWQITPGIELQADSSFPYKTSLEDLEKDLKGQLLSQLVKPKALPTSAQQKEINIIIQYRVREMVKSVQSAFYHEDREKVLSSTYEIPDKDVRKYKLKPFLRK